MVSLNANLMSLLQTYKKSNTNQSAVNQNAENKTAQNPEVKEQSVNVQPKAQPVVPEKTITPIEAVSKVNTTTNTNSAIFKTSGNSLYNSLLMVSGINVDNNGRVVDYEAEFLKTYKSEITSTLYNKIVNKLDLTQEDLAVFEQGIGKLSAEDQKMWKSEISSVREKIKSSVKETPVTPFSGVKDGILYQNGNTFSGIYSDGKYYQNGKLSSGTVNGKLYQNGLLCSGEQNGIMYQNGVAFTGTLNNVKYQNGVKVVEEQKPVAPKQEEKTPMEKLGLNGELDTQFKQGSTGDCWALSAIIALNTTEEGKQIIKDAIGVDKNGNATVTFKGLNKTYTITKEEIAKYDTDNISNDAFSNGDNDALVLEIAAAKARIDLAKGTVKTPIRLYNYNNGETKDLSSAAYAGYSAAMLYFLTGKESDWTYTTGIDTKEEVFATLARAKNQMKKGETVMTFSLGQGTNSAACVDTDTPFSVNIKTGHAFAVTDLNDETITIVNPWDSAKAYTMTWEEFAKMKITQFSFLGL